MQVVQPFPDLLDCLAVPFETRPLGRDATLVFSASDGEVVRVCSKEAGEMANSIMSISVCLVNGKMNVRRKCCVLLVSCGEATDF